jgi:hypothetical protein
MRACGAIARVFSVTPTVIRIGLKASSMIRGLPFEHVPDVRPFFILRAWIIPRKSKLGNVIGKSATSRKSVDPPPGDKWAQSGIEIATWCRHPRFRDG